MTSAQISSKTNYDIEENIGSGSFGIVNKIRIKEDGKVYALKSITLKKLKTKAEREVLLNESIAEYNLLKQDIGNVVKAYGSYYDKDKEVFLISMDFFPSNLKEYIENIYENGKSLSVKDYLPIMKDIVQGEATRKSEGNNVILNKGLRNLYKDGKAIHRDLKPENILMKEGRATIADVGVAKTFGLNETFTKVFKDVTSVTGTAQWMAPEMLGLLDNKIKFGEQDFDQSKLDIFSLGLISLFALDYKNFLNADDLNSNSRKLSKLLLALRKDIGMPVEFYYILRCMLSYSNATRPDIEELYSDIESLYLKICGPQSYKYSLLHELKADSSVLTQFNTNLNAIQDKEDLILEKDIFSSIEKNDVRLLLFSQRILNFTKVTELRLRLQNSNISDLGLAYISAALQNMNPLEHFQIRLYKNEVTDEGLGHITKAFSQQKELKILGLYFHNTKVTDDGLIKALNSLRNIRHLYQLHLSFANQNSSDHTVKIIFGSLLQLKNQVNDVFIYFNNAQQISNQGILFIKDYLPTLNSSRRLIIVNAEENQLKTLESLKLTFENLELETFFFPD